MPNSRSTGPTAQVGHKGYIYSSQTTLWGERDVVGFGDAAFHVAEIDRNRANAIVRSGHYSKTIAGGSRIHLGVFAPGLLGVLQYGCAMNPASQASVVSGTNFDEYLELNRMWLNDELPKCSASRAIALSFKYIKRKFPKIAWIQSFADERCRRFGVVYQAANFLYLGEHTSRFWEFGNRFYHNSALTNSFRAQTPLGRLLRGNRERLIGHDLRQFRYIYFLRRGFQARLKHKVLRFPKCASEGSTESRAETIGEGRGQILHDAPVFQTLLFS